MKERRVIIIYLLLSILLTACPMDREHGVGVKNNSNQIIVIAARYILPDTLLPEDPKQLVTININERRFIFGSTIGDTDLERLHRGERLTLFILSKDSVNSHSWKYIRENNVILKRYEFNMEELNNMGGTIIYP